jgi:hypothetical protein
MNPDGGQNSWISGKWTSRIFWVAIAVIVGVLLQEKLLHKEPFLVSRIEAPDPHEFVAWFNEQLQRCTAEEAAEFNKAVGIIYAHVGLVDPKDLRTTESGRAALCRELDGQIVADVIIRSYGMANEQLIRFISRQQGDVLRIIGSAGPDDVVQKKPQVIQDAQSQLAKNKERIAALRALERS